jgi:hypothetical protein
VVFCSCWVSLGWFSSAGAFCGYELLLQGQWLAVVLRWLAVCPLWVGLSAEVPFLVVLAVGALPLGVPVVVGLVVVGLVVRVLALLLVGEL